jgi:hypothetical protein
LKPLFDWIKYCLENSLAKRKPLETVLKKLEKQNLRNIYGPAKAVVRRL